MASRQEKLQKYYAEYFPVKDFCRWLAHGKDSRFTHREISFTLKQGEKEIYVRYKSYNNDRELKEYLTRQCPDKLDIGAVYNEEPKRKQTLQRFVPEEKELVFDIDLTDYDDVRQCCHGKDLCASCWKISTCAINVVQRLLNEAFGYNRLLFVFSGGRGVHVWCCDEQALDLKDEERRSIVEYLSVFEKKNVTIPLGDGATTVDVPRLQYSIRKKLEESSESSESLDKLDDLLRSVFESHIRPTFKSVFLSAGPNSLDNPATRQRIVAGLKALDPQIAGEIAQKVEMALSANKLDYQQRWKEVENVLRKLTHVYNQKDKRPGGWQIPALEMSFVWPRLDVKVSEQRGHLLKSPYCVHPGTGKICLTWAEATQMEGFDPTTAPTLDKLLNNDKFAVSGFGASLGTFSAFINEEEAQRRSQTNIPPQVQSRTQHVSWRDNAEEPDAKRQRA